MIDVLTCGLNIRSTGYLYIRYRNAAVLLYRAMSQYRYAATTHTIFFVYICVNIYTTIEMYIYKSYNDPQISTHNNSELNEANHSDVLVDLSITVFLYTHTHISNLSHMPLNYILSLSSVFLFFFCDDRFCHHEKRIKCLITMH